MIERKTKSEGIAGGRTHAMKKGAGEIFSRQQAK